MGENANTCIKHPEVEVRRKCYQCLAPICPACQRRALGHIFCSVKCQRAYWISDRVLTIKRFFLRISLRFRKVERSLEKVVGGGLLRIISLVLLMIILGQTITLIRIAKGLDGPSPAASTEQVSSPEIEVAAEGDWITISGYAPGFSMAVLLKDGRETDVCAISEGHFTFNLNAEEKHRAVQVQVFGDSLPTLFSRSYPLAEIADGPESAITTKTDRSPAELPAAKMSKAPPVKGGAKEIEPPPEALASHDDFNRGNPDHRRVAITFDGGSYSNAAERILEVLNRRGLKATFFLTGEFIKRYPDVTRQIASAGHEVGNHMYSHPHLTTFAENFRQEVLPGVTREFVIEELKKNEELFEGLTGKKMVPLWRAPYGEQNETIRQWAGQAGYRHVSWTFDPKTRKSLDGLDWVSDTDSALYLTSDQIVRKILSFDRETDMGLAGGIVLLHLGSERKIDPFYPKLDTLIEQLEKRGYKLGMVSNLFERKGGG